MKYFLPYLLVFSFNLCNYSIAQDNPVKEDISFFKPKESSKTPSATLKKANKFFMAKAYSEAIPYYEKALKKDSTNAMILSNLGDCYRLTNNLNGQLLCYEKLLKTEEALPIHNLYYGQALTQNGQIELAKPYFENYNADARGKNLASSLEKTKDYEKNSDAYKIEMTEFNSLQNDFCAVKYNEAIVFASSRNSTKWINKKHGWTSDSYLKLYATENISSGSGKFTKPTLFLGDLNSKYNDGPISFTKDFKKVFFTRNNSFKKSLKDEATFKLKIYEADLGQKGFDKTKELPFNSVNYNCAHPSISSDGNYLFFASDMPGGFGGMDIYYSKKEGDAWGTPINLGDKINTPGTEVFPFIAANGNLYFSSNGQNGLGGLDVYETLFKDEKIGKLYNMGLPVNSTFDDFGIFLDDSLKSGYLSSNRKNGGMDDDIYYLNVLREVKRGKDVLLVTKDKNTGEIIPNIKLAFNQDTIITNEKGEYLAFLEDNINYNLNFQKTDYLNLKDSVSTKSSSDYSFKKDLLLEKEIKVVLLAYMFDSKTNKPLKGAKITIKDLPNKTIIDTYTTTPQGDYRRPLTGKKIGDKIVYQFTIEKPGFLTKTATFFYEIKGPGEILVNESLLNMSLVKLELGMDLAKMIEINPIYFDYAKSDIREDAALELDRIVRVMKEYPKVCIELGSHTDCRGDAESNLLLSQERALASVAYIVNKGIKKSRIVGKGFGESKIDNGCDCEGDVQSTCPEEVHAKNRKTECIITKL